MRINQTAKKILRWVALAITSYFLYLLVFGVVIFNFISPKETNYLVENPVERFFSEHIGQDQALLFEGGLQSGARRLSLINNAHESIWISSYTFLEGEYTDIFLASLFQAADRGVEVRIIVDGVFSNFTGVEKELIYGFHAHPNIEFRVYEPLNLLKPWVLNNRLHDKIMIVDDKWATIGGRNIGDKYFDMGHEEKLSHDREVFIINTDEDNDMGSVIREFNDYYTLLWESDYTESPISRLSRRREERGQEKIKELAQFARDRADEYPELFDSSLDWLEEAFPTNRVTLIHNPIERLNKEPWVWQEITRLMTSSTESIFVQSPYIVPTKEIQKYTSNEPLTAEITVLTNSLASNPNSFALSGHMPHREAMVDIAGYFYEYQGGGSIHGKTYMFDNRISMIGSYNLDPRSTFLSTETMVVIDSEEFAEHLQGALDNLFAQSLLVDDDYTYVSNMSVEKREVPRFKSIKIRLYSIFSYFFRHML